MRSAESFDAFYAGSVRRVTAQMYAMTGDRAEAKDCVQEAYARAWQRWGSVSEYDDPEAWVRAVAYRIGVDHWRRALRRSTAHRRHGPAGDLPPADADRVAVISALRQIPAAQRQAVVLYHLVGLPVEQVAKETGVPAGTVKARLSRGRKALAALLTDQSPAAHQTGGSPPMHEEELDAMLKDAAERFATAMSPRPVHQVRERGDRRRRHLTVLRTVLVMLALAAGGGTANALVAHGGPAGHGGPVTKPAVSASATPRSSAVMVTQSVDCVSATDCWLTGYQAASVTGPQSSLIEHWDGSHLSVVRSPGKAGNLAAVSCSGPHACWAVSQAGGAEHWNGTRWSASRLPLPAGSSRPTFRAVTCPGAAECWVVGSVELANSRGQQVLRMLAERWNGSGWSFAFPLGQMPLKILTGVSCVSGKDCWATGWWQSQHATSGGILAYHWTGSSWSPVAVPSGGITGDAISCAAGPVCVIAGLAAHSFRGFAQVFRGSSWKVTPTGSPAESELLSVSCVRGGWCMAAGEAGAGPGRSRPLAERWTAKGWSVVPSQTPAGHKGTDFISVSCSSRSDCLGLVFAGLAQLTFVEHWNGTHWTIVH